MIAESQLVRHGERLHRMLIAELSGAGCFRPASVRTAAYGAFILASYAAAYATLLTGPGIAVRALAIVALAFISVHAGFIAHEACHGAITRDRRVAALVGQVFNTLLTALCYSYFCHIHRLHHPHCNERARDPDMQSGVFSMYEQSAHSKSGLGRLVSRHQAILIWVLVWLQGFTLKIDSLQHLRRNPRTTRVDQAVVLLHFALWFVPPVVLLGLGDALLNYALMTLLIGPYLGTIFLVNHIGTRVIEPDESISFFLHEISVTRNLGASRLHDFLFGGLNNHIEHHLFPSMPTAHLRSARRITREFCHRHGIAYSEMSWLAAAREVARHFKAMSAFVPG
ncbi:MAG TPA: acyl-CoA desaturase [Burkholderiales bacterium]|nr:acyl-CoA desaturase [Burkholderiales bacterium]